MKYIIGNWKANKNFIEAKQWAEHFLNLDIDIIKKSVEIIICPPYPFLQFFSEKFANYPTIKIGSQDVSVFYEGAYTGEVTAKSIKGLVDYAIIGHSERRHNFNETDQILANKASHANTHNIEPIYCVRSGQDTIPRNIKFIAYEPVTAIGTGENESVESVIRMKQSLKIDNNIYIYGGSVNEKNSYMYLKNNDIDGVLVGGASLDPNRFFEIAKSCL